MGDFHTTSMCRFMVATQAALWPLATAPAATRHRRMQFSEATEFYAWKGYDFDILYDLWDEDYIRQGSHPSRTKRVYLTDSGLEYARKLLEKYGISDWK